VTVARVLLAAALALAAGRLARAQPPAWPDTFVARVEALALMQTLNAELLASRSATETLERWCGDHHLAAEPRIAARLVTGADKPPSPEQRQRLQIGPADPVKYRHVRLQCGSHVLSEADNWYVPARLTADMNRRLDTTDTPFGTVVRPLEPVRQTLAATMLWSPLPPRWEVGAADHASNVANGTIDMPPALFAHRAVLVTADRVPFAEVYEVYQREILAFAPPVAR
jgi:hypothetical protein